MIAMPTAEFSEILAQFRQTLQECRELYVFSGELAVREQRRSPTGDGPRLVQLMEDLHGALVLKIFVSIGECDRQWSKHEQVLAEALAQHLWNRKLEGQPLCDAIKEMSAKAATLKWYALVRPFDQIAALRNRIGQLETIVIRLAHLVARADGPIKDVEIARIKSLQDELHVHLRPIPIDEPAEHAAAEAAAPKAIEKVFETAEKLPTSRGTSKATSRVAEKPGAVQLSEALAELGQLVGLADVKHEVQTLANFLKVQGQRRTAGLPVAALSLHMVFRGNPGTGKTSVARIVGKIFGAMGVLKRGHLVETDRSGLVAEYAGQTGPKSHKKIDEALDGVLFIDEAYTLVAAKGNDPYGHEAVQTLLKRMEDNRDRLVVILAGYPNEMDELLESNPGLLSRFSRHLEFADYSPLELASIFSTMCGKNHYRLDAATRAKTMCGLTWLYRHRDRHFGNGRTVRNLFEHAIRRQANRIAEITELSVTQLSTLESGDVEFQDCPPEALAPLDDPAIRFRIACPYCQHASEAPAKYLGQAVRCPKCKKQFVAEWGDLI